MKPETHTNDPNGLVSPHAQEVEFALLLSRMINTVKDDPSQMRLAIYEFARARLKTDTGWADKNERQRLSAALETAILGVERFSARHGENEELRLPLPSAAIEFSSVQGDLPSSSRSSWQPVNNTPTGTLVPEEFYLPYRAEFGREAKRRRPVSTGVVVWIVLLTIGAAGALWAYVQGPGLVQALDARRSPQAVATTARPSDIAPVPNPPQQAPPAVDTATAGVSSGSPPFPLPTDYGVYVLNNATLSELSLLPEQVPDKRVAMSTPVNQPSRTMLADGKAKFVLFRRDLANSAPDRLEVRVVARVVRAVTFDSKGKPNSSQVSDAWNIRNISYEFRVRPLAGHPEMLLVQPSDPEFLLPAGRYVLALKNEGYDFSVPGKVTEPTQCLERTDAANGSFYSDCR